LPVAYFRSVAAVLADAADTLHYAHEAGILHRDMKPSNVMVDRMGQCWIIDFGLAAHLASGGRKPPDVSTTSESTAESLEAVSGEGVLGTPQYMAPEQWRKDKLDPRADVWGLGATLYELLALRRAFDGASNDVIQTQVLEQEPARPSQWVRGVPGDLSAICLKALEKDPNRRYPTARQFGEDLRRWLRREPTAARPGLHRRIGLWCLRNKGWAAAIALALTAFLGVVSAELQVAREREDVAKAKAGVSREREDSAKALAAANGQRAQERSRDLLLQQMQLLRLMEHHAGWSDAGWKMVRDAARFPHDDELRNQAAAFLVGMDARLDVDFTGQFNASSIAFEREGKRLLIGGFDKRENAFDKRKNVPACGARLWNGAEPLVISQLLGAGPVAFRRDGTPLQLAPDAKDRLRLILWDIGRQKQVQEFRFSPKSDPQPLNKRNGPLMDLTTDPDQVAASAVLADGSTQAVVWDGASGKAVREIDAGARKITALAVAPDGSCLATGDQDGRIVLWPLPDGASVELPSAGRTMVNGLAFGRSPRRVGRTAPDRRNWLLAAADAGGTATVWDLERGAAQSYGHGSNYEIYRVAFRPDGAVLASAGRYYTRLWDVATGRPLTTLYRADFMTGLAFSSDGARLAVSTQDGFAKDGGAQLWTLEPGRGIQLLLGLSSQVSKVCMTPDGRRVAALSHDWQAAVWDGETGSLLRLLDAPHGDAADNAALTLSADGLRLACAAGTEAKLWDLITGEEKSWTLPPGLQDNMAFDPSGQRLLLVRVEIADGVSWPWGGAYPSVCPLRDLLGKEPMKPIRIIDYFDRQVFQVRMAAAGAWFAIKGLHW
jgi:WD40 repeat protein